MKYRILSIFGLFVAGAFLFSACTKSDIVKSQESYDWSKVQPKIMNFAGPSLVSASGQVASNYSVAGRGGSSYEFTAHNWGADIVVDPTFNFKVSITWNQASADTMALLTVVETTHAGVKSDPDTLEVTLDAFCPMTIDDFVSASWTGTETGDSVIDPFTVSFEKGTGDVIIAKASGGIPAFLSQVFTGWGESFQAGFGNEGDIHLTIGALDGSISGTGVYWGQTLPGPYDYWQVVGGNWNGCGASPHMSISYGLDWSDDGGANRQSQIEIDQN